MQLRLWQTLHVKTASWSVVQEIGGVFYLINYLYVRMEIVEVFCVAEGSCSGLWSRTR